MQLLLIAHQEHMKAIKYLLFLIFFITSCAQRGDKNVVDATSVLLFSDTDVEVGQADFFANADTLLLESSDFCQLRSMTKIVMAQACYYVLDRSADVLYVFDQCGKYVRKVGERGRGASEFLGIEDFTIDSQTGKVVILSKNSKVLEYDSCGVFLRSKVLCESLLWNIISTDWGYVASTNHRTYVEGEEAYLLFCFDKDFNLLNKHVRVLPYQVGAPVLLSAPLQIVNDVVYYCDAFQRKIYTLSSPNEVMERYRIDLSNSVPQKYLTSAMGFIEHQQEFNFLMDFIVRENQLIIPFVMDKKYRLCEFDFAGNVVRNGIYTNGTFPKSFHAEGSEMLIGTWVEDEQIEEMNAIVRWR